MQSFQKQLRKNSSDVEQLERAPLTSLCPDQNALKPNNPYNKSDALLHELTSSTEKNESEIIQLLENNINDPNFDINGIIDGYSLTHRACLSGKPNVLEKLLKYGADINQRTCNGDTPLICVMQSCTECDLRELSRRSLLPNEDSDAYESVVCYSHIRCAKTLINRPNIDLDANNNNGLTALSFATRNLDELKRDKYVKLLLQINDGQSFCCGIYKALQGKLDSQFVVELNLLVKKIGETKTLQFMYKNYTFLQAVCKFGMLESTKRLIQMGADVNFTPIVQKRPIELVCEYAQPDILRYLIQKNAHILPKTAQIINEKNRNLLHQTAKTQGNKSRSHECLKILLKEKPAGFIGDVNDKDHFGKTPLHYATACDNELCIVELLEHGAKLNEPDKWKRTPLMHISPAAFKKYLNNMISGGKVQNKNQSDLTFNFETLFQQRNGRYYFPTSFLCEIKEMKKLRKLLQHPIFSLIIYFKWQNVQIMFYFYFLLYTIFCITYTLLVVIEVDLRNNAAVVASNATIAINSTVAHIQPLFCTNTSIASISLNTMLSIFTLLELFKIIGGIWRYFTNSENYTNTMLSIITLLELFKIIGGIWRYFTNSENYLRLIVIILSFSVIQCLVGTIFEEYCNHLKAFSLLLTCFEFFLVLGKHPKFSFHVTTFKSASIGLLKFLIVHFVLLLGFALSFHTLFRSDSLDNIFTNPLYAIFKTTVMLTSEFDSGDIPFNGYPGISHLIFIAYIFIATIVLFNLMIGLAFSKVNEMEKNPTLYESLACIDIITHFESHFLSRFSNFNIFSVFNLLKRNKRAIPKKPRKVNGHETEKLPPKIMVNEDNYLLNTLKFDADGKISVLKLESRRKICSGRNAYKIYDQIAEKARKIVSKKVNLNEESKKDVKNLNNKLEAIANELATVKNFQSNSIVAELSTLKNSIDVIKDLLQQQKQ